MKLASGVTSAENQPYGMFCINVYENIVNMFQISNWII